MTDLQRIDSDSLEHYEKIAMNGLDQAWRALVTIRNNKLYRVRGYNKFEDYVLCTYDYSLRHVHRQLSHVEICDLLQESTGTQTANESQSRELASLPDDKKIEVWTRVQETSKAIGEPVTTAMIKAAKVESAGLPARQHTFIKTVARAVKDYREAVSVSDDERVALRSVVAAFLQEIDEDSSVVAAA